MTKRYILTALLFSALLIFPGCYLGLDGGSFAYGPPAPVNERPAPPPWAPAHGRRARHVYRYYPSSGIYFDTGRGLYFYYRDGSWAESASLPGGMRINVNDAVTLGMDTARPYIYNNEVVKRYPRGQMKKKNREKKEKYENRNKHRDKYEDKDRGRDKHEDRDRGRNKDEWSQGWHGHP